MTALVANEAPGLGASAAGEGSRSNRPSVVSALRDLVQALQRMWGAAATELSPAKYLVFTSLVVLAVLTLSLWFDVIVVSRFEYRAAQAGAVSRLRNELAHGVAPLGQVDRKGRLLKQGVPVALLVIPALHLRAAVLEGTNSQVLTSGPGHLRDTVLPGEAGTSVLLGRAAAYGGPFGGLHRLHSGDKITVTTGLGTSTFSVTDLRTAGDPVPPLADGAARLTLVTATGAPFLPSGVLRVDADLSGSARTEAPLVLTTVSRSEAPMGTDTSSLWVLAFLLQGLILASVAAVWSWRRWGRAQTWIVFFPLFVLLGYYASDQFMRLLPNLM
jgi:sortase A